MVYLPRILTLSRFLGKGRGKPITPNITHSTPAPNGRSRSGRGGARSGRKPRRSSQPPRQSVKSNANTSTAPTTSSSSTTSTSNDASSTTAAAATNNAITQEKSKEAATTTATTTTTDAKSPSSSTAAASTKPADSSKSDASSAAAANGTTQERSTSHHGRGGFRGRGRGRGRGGFNSHRRFDHANGRTKPYYINVDAETLKYYILQQMYVYVKGMDSMCCSLLYYSEYYFSIDNLCKDMFLRSQVSWY